MKIYLGDGVYAQFKKFDHLLGTPWILTLTAENGIETTSTIYLGMEEFDRLVQFVIQEGNNDRMGEIQSNEDGTK